MKRPIERVEVSMQELEEILERAKTSPLPQEEYAKLRKALETLEYLTELVGDKDTTISRLRKILFGESAKTGSPPAGPPEIPPGDPAADSSQERVKDTAATGLRLSQERSGFVWRMSR